MNWYNGTKAEKIIFVCFGLMVVAFGILYYYIKAEDKKFVKEGIRVDALVSSMSASGTRKHPNYKMTISMFTKGEVHEVHTDTTGKSETDKVIDKIFDDIKSKSSNIGKFKMITINVSGSAYNKFKPGDKVVVVYLKEDPEDVRLLYDLE